MTLLWRTGRFLAVIVALAAASCTDGGSQEGRGVVSGSPGGAPPPATATGDQPTELEAASFLSAATFGPTRAEIDHLVNIGYSAWFREQYAVPMTAVTTTVPLEADFDDTVDGWWRNTVYGRDQLRQRAAFALSQIFVVSGADGDLRSRGHAFARYIDLMQESAFASYRDVLEEVTYSPAMGVYLTYIGNEKADPDKGSVPDENYAREVMQLFSIGVVELNSDGTERLDGDGRPIETYDNMDITELAKVFTGLWWDGLEFRRDRDQITPAVERAPMAMSDDAHSTASKTFLGLTIPAGVGGEETIARALDHLAQHPNTAPFISRQLIQRFVTSNPSPQYVARVAAVFREGTYTLPDGTVAGSGRTGDFSALWPAILLDEQARDPDPADTSFGKVREPVVRFAHWARAFSVNSADAAELGRTRRLDRPDRLNQQPYRSPSVFNFYRPGYVAPATNTGEAGLVAPELQITDSNSVIGYANFMRLMVLRTVDNAGDDQVFIPNYNAELALADDPDALVDRLDLLLLAGRLTPEGRDRMRAAIAEISHDEPEEERLRRVQAAVLLAVMSPEYLVQY